MNNKTKTLLALAMSGLMASSAMASSTPVDLTWDGKQASASFEGKANQNDFSFNLSGLSSKSALFITLSSTFGVGAGYDITSATFEGKPFTAVWNHSSTTAPAGFDVWTYQATNLDNGVYNFSISGLAKGGGFNGTLSLTTNPVTLPPVPEPGTYALLLAGLGVVALVARRRGLQG